MKIKVSNSASKFKLLTLVHVIRYGSDPLKTYLPDSDIDITVIPITGRAAALG